jgi:spermidine synthase
VSRAFSTALAGLGFTALLLQIILTRELLASFFGNELCIGLILVDWLLLVAIGSGPLGALILRRRPGYGAFVVVQLLVAILLPVSVFLSRCVSGGAMFPGEVIGPLVTLLLAALVLLPCCVLLGLQFAVGCSMASGTGSRGPRVTQLARQAVRSSAGARTASRPCHPEESRSSVPAVSRVYVLESLGAVLGGLLFHYWLADHLQPMRAVLLLGAANAACACAVALVHLDGLRMTMLASGAGTAAAVLVAYAALPMGDGLAWESLTLRWRGFELIASENSRYGNLAVTAAEGQRSFFQDGLLMFTTEYRPPSEELAHLTLLQHPRPARVLLVSGGLGGTLGQMLQHPIERLDYVELDARVVPLAREHLPAELKRPLDDPRVAVHFLDGRRFVADTARASQDSAGEYDAIVVGLPDPYTAMLNRFYTEQFFREAAAALRRGGIFCTTLSSSESFLMGPRQLLHASVYRALSAAFAEVLVIPGDPTYFLCATQKGVLTADDALLSRRFRERELQCTAVQPFLIEVKLWPFRRDQYMEALGRAPPTEPNDDFRPITYYYFLRLWVRQFSPGLADALASAGRAAAWVVGVALGAAAIMAGGLWWWRRYDTVAVVSALAATGLVEMGLSLIVLFAFQVIAGYIFYQLGILATLYMAGLAVGAALGRRQTRAAARPSALLFAGCLAALAALCLVLPYVLAFLQARAAWANTVLGAVAFTAGGLGGCAFPLAIGLTAPSGADTARTGAALYAADLLGGAFGALLVTLAALPALGLAATCNVLGLLVLAGLILVIPSVARAMRGRGGTTVS